MPGKKNEQGKGISAAQTKIDKTWTELMRDADKDIAFKMALVEFEMETLKDPDDILSQYICNTDGEIRENLTRHLQDWKRKNFELTIKEASKITGQDPEQIANNETPTPEQQQALYEASARVQIARKMLFSNCDFMIALQALNSAKGVYEHPGYADQLKRLFTLYYFTTRPFSPTNMGSFTHAEKEQLVDQYRRFEVFMHKYYEEAEENDDKGFFHVLKKFIEQENPTEAKEIIENLTSVLPSNYVMPNSKLVNTLDKGIIDIGRITLEESRRGAKKLIETNCILTYEGENVKLSGRQTFTEYDRSVYNAVSSLYVYGDQSHVITPAMVYRAMTGLTGSEKPPTGQLAAITRSLDKMRFIRARIDCTAEFQARRIVLNSEQINSGEIDTYLLTADAIKVKAGGQTVKAYRIIKAPILYEYSSALKQVLTLPSSLLDIKEMGEMYDADGNKKSYITTRSLPNTETRIRIKNYLLRRIEGIKGKNALNNHTIALYDYTRSGETHQGLYSIAGKPDADRKEMQRIREDAEKMLAYWAATGYIKAFETQAERKKITGYKIIV